MMTHEQTDETKDDNLITRERFVEVQAEAYAGSLWDKQARSCAPEELPVPQTLHTRLENWHHWYERMRWLDLDRDFNPYDPDSNTHNPAPFMEDPDKARELRAFSDEGLRIARAIKEHLPAYTVMYFDEEASHRGVWESWKTQRISHTPRRAHKFEIIL